MKLVVAVSGGVDSVVLLDKLVRSWRARAEGTSAQHELQGVEQQTSPFVVAHFDHGIRVDSADDARFVENLAKHHQLPFEVKREELGADASEDLARTRRYQFLRAVAKKHGAKIATGHHMNDAAETIAINLVRGTGWRGLAVLASDIERPLLGLTKPEILDYAKEQGLEWREDSTNQSDAYLRNRLRGKLVDEDIALQLAALRARQIELRDEIGRELANLSLQSPHQRYLFVMAPSLVGHELMRQVTFGKLTRPQQERALNAIKTFRPGSRYEAGAGVLLHFTPRHFTVQMLN